LQASHEAFVSAYFQLSRQRVEDFLDQRWIPTFLGNFVEQSNLMQALENVRPLTDAQNTHLQANLQSAGISPADQAKVIQAVDNAFGDPDRGKQVLLFSEAALKQIQIKRKALLAPIDEQERKSLDELRKVYAQVQQAQDAVTAHLSSVQKVTEEQDQVLERLGLLKTRDAVIDKALETNQEIMSVLDAGKSAEQTVTDLETIVKQLGSQGSGQNPPNH
jgi:DNA repair ATPase RecN